jgi:hypothetical protein
VGIETLDEVGEMLPQVLGEARISSTDGDFDPPTVVDQPNIHRSACRWHSKLKILHGLLRAEAQLNTRDSEGLDLLYGVVRCRWWRRRLR